MTTGREPQIGGQPQGNEPMLGDKDYSGDYCDWCGERAVPSTMIANPNSTYLLCQKCYRKSKAIWKLFYQSLRRKDGATMRW
jgi:hypothetical protein